MSMKQKQLAQTIAMIVAIAVAMFLLFWAPLELGAQSADPTPVCTMTPDGLLCTSSVAMTMTPTSTPIAPTVASTLDPFVPTATTQPTPTNTTHPTFTPTSIVISPLPLATPKAHLPIVRVP